MSRMPTVQRSSLLAVCVLAGLQLAAQATEPKIQPPAQSFSPPPATYNAGQIYWRPLQTDQGSFAGAVTELAQNLQRDQYLSERGVIHSMNFQYRAFRYEKNFFEVYKGVLLRSFLDGRVDLGLFNHRMNRQYYAPRGPGRNNRYELLLRLNIQ